MTDIIKSVGAGKDYADLSAFFAAVPSNLVTATERWIAQVYGHIVVSSSQVLGSRTTSALYNVIIEAAPNEGTFNPAFIGQPLYFDSTKGGAITSNASGAPAIKFDSAAFTVIRGLQIKAANSAIQQAIYLIGSDPEVSRNIIERNATDSGVALLFQAANNLKFHDNVLVSTGTASAAVSCDTSAGVEYTGNTIYAPNGTTNVGLFGQPGSNPLSRDNLIIGFTQPMPNASSSSSNNGTSAASLAGTSNQLNLVAANVFTSTTDLRIKAGAPVIGAGVTVAGRTTDILGQTLSSPPSIGAAEYAAASGAVGLDLAVSYNVAATVGADLALSYSVSAAGTTVVGVDLALAYAVRAAVGIDLSVAYSVAPTPTGFTSQPFTKNSTTVRNGDAVNWEWYSGGVFGQLSGITPTAGSGALTAAGVLVLSGLPAGPGLLLARTPADDGYYAQPGTVA